MPLRRTSRVPKPSLKARQNTKTTAADTISVNQQESSDDDWESICDASEAPALHDKMQTMPPPFPKKDKLDNGVKEPSGYDPCRQDSNTDITWLLQKLQADEASSKQLNMSHSAAPPFSNTLTGAVNPLVYLTGPSAETKAYDICDFVNLSAPITVEWSECKDSAEVLEQYIKAKSGAKRPKLEDVTVAQWGIANTRIMDKLFHADGIVNTIGLRQYMAYTCKVFELLQKYDRVKVLQYDRRYRMLQATHLFPWGTDLPHLDSMHLTQEISNKQTSGKTTAGGQQGKQQSTICHMYNQLHGCKFGQRCNFKHVCNKCQAGHPEFAHKDSIVAPSPSSSFTGSGQRQ